MENIMILFSSGQFSKLPVGHLWLGDYSRKSIGQRVQWSRLHHRPHSVRNKPQGQNGGHVTEPYGQVCINNYIV